MRTLEKSPEPNATYVLSELEKYAEDRNSFWGIYGDIDELMRFREATLTDFGPKFIQDQKSHSFFELKVINFFKVKEPGGKNEKYCNTQHGRAHKKYSMVFDANFIKRKASESQLDRNRFAERFSERANRARQVNKIYDSIHKRAYSVITPAFSKFTVNLIDTENWASSFNPKCQKDTNAWKKVFNIYYKKMIDRLDFEKKSFLDTSFLLHIPVYFSWLILHYVKSWCKTIH